LNLTYNEVDLVAFALLSEILRNICMQMGKSKWN